MVFRDEETRRAWDAIHRGRVAAIPPAVLARLPDLEGRHVLHLACGRGRATAELLERGALVTAVDDDEQALAEAREHAPDAAIVRGDVNDLPIELRRGRFDVAFTEHAERVHELAAVAVALKAGGSLFLVGEHPAGACVDSIDLRWREDYFERRTIGATVAACVEAGLVVTEVVELASSPPWRRLDKRVPGILLTIATKS